MKKEFQDGDNPNFENLPIFERGLKEIVKKNVEELIYSSQIT